jgi:uncharacterized protein with NAD-binding domain and iron-sulfur cluster
MQGRTHSQPVTVIGGGLAGMVAALELVKRGFDVTLHEASGRLGGKAGSDTDPPLHGPDHRLDPSLSLPDGVQIDHGYHVFPLWYTNMRRLWEEVGIDPATDVYQGMVYRDLKPARNGQRQPLEPEAPPKLRQLMAICDLVLQPDDAVDDLTLQAFLHSRPYANRADPISLNDFILNALTIGDADISSRVVRDVFRQWLPLIGKPNWDALRGSLGDVLIDRIEARIRAAAEAAGATFTLHYHHRLTKLELDGGYTMKLTLASDDGEPITVTDQPVIVAIPPQVLRTLDSTELYRNDSGISGLHYLRCNPFSALDVFFDADLDGFDKEHFTLHGSPYGITGFDISKHWPRLESRRKTVLQFVAANSRCFSGLDDEGFVRVMAEEIARFIPEVADQVAFYVPHRNFHDPLFVNDVGTLQHRPQTRSKLPNLYFAGDYVDNPTVVTSMEAAVRTGLMAAEELRRDHSAGSPPVEILDPVELPEEVKGYQELYAQDPLMAQMQTMRWLEGVKGSQGALE